MEDLRVPPDFALMFFPERWPSVKKFGWFLGPPFEPNRDIATGTNAAEGHLAKFGVLAGLANRLKNHLAEDAVELEKFGHGSGARSREFAALVETLFCELYAALDGVRRTLYGAYRNVRGVQKESTERLFRRAKEKKYGPEFPEDIRATLASAYDAWFPRLRSIRSEVTHGEIGGCHLDAKSQKVRYMHQGLGTPTRAMVIDDVVGEVNSHFQSVSKFVESVYRPLCSKLEPVEKPFVCGIYRARIYQRVVAFSADMSFHSGRCATWELFENEPGTECPLREFCGAYKRVKTPH